MASPDEIPDIVAGSVFLGLVIVYHVWLFSYSREHPHATVTGIASAVRTAWITGMLKKPDNILAAQLLRNWVLTAQLLAGASVSIMFGMLAFVVNTNQSSSGTAPDFIGFVGTFRGFKIAVLLLIYLIAFLCFAQVARMFGHVLVSYTATNYTLKHPTPVEATSISARTFPLPKYPVPTDVAASFLAHLLNGGAFYWTVGTRLFSFSFPVLLWFFGAWYMFVAGGCTVLMLVALDLAGVTAKFELWAAGEDEEVLPDDDNEQLDAIDGHHHHHHHQHLLHLHPHPAIDEAPATANSGALSVSSTSSASVTSPFPPPLPVPAPSVHSISSVSLAVPPATPHGAPASASAPVSPQPRLPAGAGAVSLPDMNPATATATAARLQRRRSSFNVLFHGHGYFPERADKDKAAGAGTGAGSAMSGARSPSAPGGGGGGGTAGVPVQAGAAGGTAAAGVPRSGSPASVGVGTPTPVAPGSLQGAGAGAGAGLAPTPEVVVTEHSEDILADVVQGVPDLTGAGTSGAGR